MAAGAGPSLMYMHCLDELKGWPDEAALDYDAKLSDTVSVSPVYGGSCVHVNQYGEFELGVGPTDMGIFLLQGSHELDVDNYGGSEWYPIAPTGKMSGLVASGAFELESTEFVASSGVPFLPGNQITSPREADVGTDKTQAGKLYNTMAWGAAPTHAPIRNINYNTCAVVSRIGHANHHGVPVVSFWPVYIPMTN